MGAACESYEFIALQNEPAMYLTIQNVADVDRYMAQLRASALRVKDWVAAQSGDPLDLLRRVKFRSDWLSSD